MDLHEPRHLDLSAPPLTAAHNLQFWLALQLNDGAANVTSGGALRFVAAKVRVVAACPLPNLLNLAGRLKSELALPNLLILGL